MESNEQTKTKELVNYEELINYAEEGSTYKTLIGKPVLWLPVQVPQGISVVKMLNDLFFKYKRLIRWYNDFDDNDKEFVDHICDSIIYVLEKYLTGDVIKAYDMFSVIMKEYGDTFPSKNVEPDITYYRMRTGMDSTKKEQFYHLPTNMREKCNSQRFSIAGYPCFYVGYSKNDCMVEISKTGSMIGLSVNEKNSLKVLDLTFSKEQNNGDQLNNYLKAFPLIASCYVVMMNNTNVEEAKFREEYVIPQMLTSYLKHQNKYDGICYYSVRNENLNHLGRGEDDYRNLVLFPNLNSTEEHDMNLMNKFHWYEPFCVR